jgi:STE24 endopeptidase
MVQTLPPMSAHFDAARATKAYLARVGTAARTRANTYFEGSHVLMIVDVAYVALLSGLILWLHVGAGMRDWARSRTRSRSGQTAIVILLYGAILAVMTFPLLAYQCYFRERSYGLSHQTFVQWLCNYGTALALILLTALVLGSILYAVIRRTPYNWWIWGAGIAVAFMVVAVAVYPAFVAPLFNQYRPLADGPLKQEILGLAHANGVEGENIFVVDASRRSPRLLSDVTGFLGTTRIVLSDNLLKHGTRDEILAAAGHEIGHYVLDHTTRILFLMALVIFLGFAFLHWGFALLANVFGGNWDMRHIEDPAGLPLLVTLGAVFLLVLTPVTNTIIRTTEVQADIFGVNAVRKPDAAATLALKTSLYRKLDPTPLEEYVFYDRPSAQSRIKAMMRWKAGHLNDPDIQSGPVSPQ